MAISKKVKLENDTEINYIRIEGYNFKLYPSYRGEQ